MNLHLETKRLTVDNLNTIYPKVKNMSQYFGRRKITTLKPESLTETDRPRNLISRTSVLSQTTK